MREGSLYASSIHSLRFFSGSKTAFHRESVRIQPVEEGGLAEDARIWILGGMNMSIWR